MEFITSRSFKLPTIKKEMESHDWFNIWQRRLFPYEELLVGDTLNWFDRPRQLLLWKTRISNIDRFQFDDKKEILAVYPGCEGSKYFLEFEGSGYFLLYRVKTIKELNVAKPDNFKFPQSGWLRLDSKMSEVWFSHAAEEESTVLDDLVDNYNGTLAELLDRINQKMSGVAPTRIRKLVETTIRNDSKIVRALKKARDYSCEFPDCGEKILKKSGDFYIEVAHVNPVAKGGKSVLGNLLVLCPNHHKEMDHGDLKVTEQSEAKLIGSLNKKPFCFSFDYRM